MRSSSSALLAGSLLLWLTALSPAQTTTPEHAADNAYLTACQQSPVCSAHLARATQLYKQEQFTEALDEYQAAYRLQPYPLILFNIARLHHKQNHLYEAGAYYQRYLETLDGERAGRARELLAEVQHAQDALEVKAEPPPAPLLPPPPMIPASAVALGKPVLAESPRRTTPLYKQWWLWTLVGAAAVGAATAIGLGIYAQGPDISGLQTKTLNFAK